MSGKAVLDLKTYLAEKRALVDRELEGRLPETGGPAAELFSAMRYSLFAGGKRLRPILCLAAAETAGGSSAGALPVACALECIHTYSLIHDDLPLMDDDDLRRGKPTNHKVFGEALALLAGDGLLTEAFRLIAETPAPPERLLRILSLIADAAGCRGMVAGQAVDIRSEGRAVDAGTVEFIHTRKTAALIRASVLAGALLAGAAETGLAALGRYGDKVGLAFQISDDILDIEGESASLGKTVGADQQRGKATYPSVLGLEPSRAAMGRLVEEAIAALRIFDLRADPLRAIARYIVERRK